MDDGSSKDVRAVLDQFEDDRIRFYRLETNQGIARATNFGFSRARGTFLSILDDDDEFEPGFLEKTREHLLKNSLDFCWCGIEEHFVDGEAPREKIVRIERTTLYQRQIVAVLIGTGFGFTFHRDCLERVTGFDEGLESCTDADFFLELVQQPLNWDGLNEVLVKVHRQSQRLTLVNDRYARSLEYILEKHKGFLSRHQAINAILNFQLGQILADGDQRQRARQRILSYLWQNPKDSRMWLLLISNELRHYSIGLAFLKVYRWFYHRYGAPDD